MFAFSTFLQSRRDEGQRVDEHLAKKDAQVWWCKENGLSKLVAAIPHPSLLRAPSGFGTAGSFLAMSAWDAPSQKGRGGAGAAQVQVIYIYLCIYGPKGAAMEET